MSEQAVLERWKYTDLSALQKIDWQSLSQPTTESSIVFAENDQQGPIRLVFIDGQFSASLSQSDRLPVGVTLHSEQMPNAEDILMGKYQLPIGESAVNFQTQLQVDSGVQCEQPIYLLMIATEQSQHCRLPMTFAVHVKEQAGLRVQTEVVSYRQVQNFTQLSTTICLDKGASCDHTIVQKESAQAFHWHQLNIEQAEGSHYQGFHLMLGGELARTDVKHALKGQAATCYHRGFYYSRNKQQHNMYVDVTHQAPHCYSDQHFKGIIDDKAHAVFNTKVTVDANAPDSEAHQNNQNLLLSSQAEIDTKPDLEIYNDDVVCSHGATVGNLNQDALFYLRSRGIGEQQARAMLTRSFAMELIEKLDAEVQQGMRMELMSALGERGMADE